MATSSNVKLGMRPSASLAGVILALLLGVGIILLLSFELTQSRDRIGEGESESSGTVAPHPTELVGDRATGLDAPTLLPQRRVEEGLTISGIAVDELGVPLEGVRVWANPPDKPQGVYADSGPDGAFRVLLNKDAPHLLSARLADHAPYHLGDTRTLHAPGTKDLRIVLPRLPTWTFQVVDPTGAPVEQFGHSYRPGEFGAHAAPIELLGDGELHAGGRVELAARADFDEITFFSEGYRRQRVVVPQGADPSRPVLVELRRSPTASVPQSTNGTIEGKLLVPVGCAPEGLELRLDEREPSRRRTAFADASGGFRFEHLSADGHSLRLVPRPGVIAAPPDLYVQLAREERRSVVIDASRPPTCTVALEITIEGSAVADMPVSLVYPGEASGSRYYAFGTTDESGRVERLAPLLGTALVTIYYDGDFWESPRTIDCLADQSTRARIDFNFGAIELPVPEGIDRSEGLTLEGWLFSESRVSQGYYSASVPKNSTARVLRIERVREGAFTASFELFAIDHADGPGGCGMGVSKRPKILKRIKAPITIRPGQTSVLRK